MAEQEEKITPNTHYDKDPLKYHNKCMSVVNDVIANNPFLNIMVESMKEFGCEITPSFFKCRPCPVNAGGYYDSKLGIVLCENNITFKTTLEDTLMHEMVHAFDTCRAELKPDDCLHIACSEVRASNLSGECNATREIARGQFRVQKQYPACVKRRASVALAMHPQCSQRAPEYIEAAWRSCYRDTAPFGFVPL